MPNRPVPAIVEWRIDCEAGAEAIVLTCIDSRTQSTYELRIPLHAAPALLEAMNGFIDGNPDLFRDVDTRRID